MKKLIALALALLMAASMTACSALDLLAKPAVDAVKEAVEELPTEASTELPTEAPTELATEAPVAETEEPSQEQILEWLFGTVEGYTYMNGWLGLGVDLSPEWFISTRDEILSMNGITGEENIIERLGDVEELMLMTAQKTDSTQSVNFIMESNQPAGITEEYYISSQLDSTAEALESYGMTDVRTYMDTVLFAGELHYCMQVSACFGETYIYETLVAYQTEDGVALITAAAQDEAALAALVASFYSLPAA